MTTELTPCHNCGEPSNNGRTCRLCESEDAMNKALTHRPAAQDVDGPIAASLGDIVALWDQHAPSEYMTEIHMQAKRALAGQQPVSPDMARWCAYVGGMVAHWVKSEPDALARLGDDAFEAAIAGIIERRLWAMPKPAPQQTTPAQEPGVFREYFDAHRALIAAKGVSERASHAHIVGYRAPSHSTGSEPYAASVARNDQLKRADDAARCARKEAEARFNAALSAAQSATQQATPEPVGDVVEIDIDEDGSAHAWIVLHDTVELGSKLYTRPAPGVPESPCQLRKRFEQHMRDVFACKDTAFLSIDGGKTYLDGGMDNHWRTWLAAQAKGEQA